MELNNTDLFILISFEDIAVFTPLEVVRECDLDKATVYKSLKRLKESKAIIQIETKPQKYTINYDKLK